MRNDEGRDSGGSGTCGEDTFLNEALAGLARGLDAGLGGEEQFGGKRIRSSVLGI